MKRTLGHLLGAACVLAFACSSAVIAQLLPTAGEFIVNSYTSSGQNYPAIAATTPGNFVVAWMSFDQDGYGWGVFARQFSEPTTPIGTEMQINSYTTDDQQRPEVAASPNGDFVVVWTSYYQDGSYTGVFAQRASSAGVLVGTEFQVNTATIGYQSAPAVVADSSKFVIVWEDYPDPENNGDSNLFGQRYDTNGNLQGSEFQLNEPNTLLGIVRSLVLTPEGFLAVYGDIGSDGDGGTVLARRFDHTGAPLSSELQVNTYTTGFQGSGRAGVSADGGFVVVWSGPGDTSSTGVFGQRFDSTGAPLGTEFQVNTYTTNQQTRPAIAVHPTGEFVVTWQSNAEDGDGYGIFARAFRADGTPDTPEIQVNQFTTEHQIAPRITAVDDRSVVIVWQSQSQDGSFNGIFGRHYRRAGERLTGKKLSIKTSAGNPNRNGLTFVSKDAALELPSTVPQDPRCPPAGSGSLASGARLRVVGSGGDFTIDLPCVNWTANASGTRYLYRDGSGATCQAIVLIAGRLVKASCKGSQVAYALGAAQDDVHVTLSTGDPATNRKYCATFGPSTAATVVRDGSDGRSYRAVRADTGVCP